MKPHDQFAKNYLEELLSPLGRVEISKEITDETRQIDVFFSPHPNRQITVDNLGLLGQIALNSALLEPYRNSPARADVRNCLTKLTAVFAELQRQSKRENIPYNEENLPRLWILAPVVSQTILNGFGAALDPNWPEGVYFLPPLQRTAIIAINQLPVNPQTLWLRLLGKGKTQNQAVGELLKLPLGNNYRQNVIELLVSWRVSVEIQNILEEEDREVFMTLSQTYLEWKEAVRRQARQEALEEGRQEGRQEGLEEGRQEGLEEGLQEARRGMIENLLQVRFGQLDDSFNPVIEGLLSLSPSESSRLLIESSREDLFQRFHDITPQ
ncbi:MAG: hypothetical protein EWV41_07040 [Microcystis wesenbergii Mw_MB_S_20031200_S109]|jgi:hypothetical protein|uniref:Flagellar assembly protein H n=1 Tax=Microcystis wesenbergii Mw_MB_S_20031200_S109D TaxID=2486241 RepID=A0A552M7Q3_9CHRO|nr:MAG: hypothetical protein EWV41_07040 [Microcystis wesenbergii Mw_MB_S_20031200_S109]TRV28494.1 MAG: hypothetical protein EWV88_03080 [Microcystis wesenbergii Mw_MB_S_20031200_S109D]